MGDTLVTSIWRTLLGRGLPVPASGATAVLPAYAALGRYRAGAPLDARLHQVVSQLAAQRSGCRWCIERGKHLWREAQLPSQLFRALAEYPTSPLFTARERAALAFADALTRYCETAGGMPAGTLAATREAFSEEEIAALTEVVAAMHFYNPITGALGADVESSPCGRDVLWR